MKLQFLGAAGQVTGSMTLVEIPPYKFLVDCGQFQGTPKEEALNLQPFSFDIHEVDFVILTHAHIDHTGRIPLLVKNGFNGKIFCSKPTSHLSEILLRDSGKIHETETAWENKKRKRAGLDIIQPLFTEEDAIESLQYLYPVEYNTSVAIDDSLSFKLIRAGHLLGSSTLILSYFENNLEKTLVFSGDLGNSTSLLENPPEYVSNADYVVIESTYGNRQHEHIQTRTDELVNILIDATQKKGTVIIPSFAVGRTQELIFELNHFTHQCHDGRELILKDIPIYVDSPMALDALKVYENHLLDMSPLVQSYDVNAFKLSNLHLVSSIEGSIALNHNQMPKVIISASGMCEAGRITHHLKHNLWKHDTHIIFVGYQADGTLGRRLLDGEKKVTIMDSDVVVNAKLHTLQGFSGHADQTHLLAWLQAISGMKKVIVNHGEYESRLSFAQLIKERLDIPVEIPELNEIVVLE